jgi:hypothetical protein
MFEIFPEGGHWCARRSDGLVCGLFRNRADAERFARLEDESGSPSQESAKTSMLTDPGLEMTARTA